MPEGDPRRECRTKFQKRTFLEVNVDSAFFQLSEEDIRIRGMGEPTARGGGTLAGSHSLETESDKASEQLPLGGGRAASGEDFHPNLAAGTRSAPRLRTGRGGHPFRHLGGRIAPWRWRETPGRSAFRHGDRASSASGSIRFVRSTSRELYIAEPGCRGGPSCVRSTDGPSTSMT